MMEVISVIENERQIVKKKWSGLDGPQKTSKNFDVKQKNFKEKLRKFRLASWVVRICTDFATALDLIQS